MTLREIQLQYLSQLKAEGFNALASRQPRSFEVSDERFASDMRMSVSLRLLSDGVLRVRSTAVDSPLSEEEKAEMDRLIPVDGLDAEVEEISWVDGFDIDSDGGIVNMHTDVYDD